MPLITQHQALELGAQSLAIIFISIYFDAVQKNLCAQPLLFFGISVAIVCPRDSFSSLLRSLLDIGILPKPFALAHQAFEWVSPR